MNWHNGFGWFLIFLPFLTTPMIAIIAEVWMTSLWGFVLFLAMLPLFAISFLLGIEILHDDS